MINVQYLYDRLSVKFFLVGHCSIVDKSSAYDAKGPVWRKKIYLCHCVLICSVKRIIKAPTLKKSEKFLPIHISTMAPKTIRIVWIKSVQITADSPPTMQKEPARTNKIRMERYNPVVRHFHKSSFKYSQFHILHAWYSIVTCK